MPEPPLKVFISSVMSDGYLEQERTTVRRAIRTLPITTPWDFATAPAEPAGPMDVALREVNRCDMFVILIDNRHSTPVQAELDSALRARKPVFCFLRRRDPETASEERRYIVSQLSTLKYAEYTSLDDLEKEVTTAISDELIRGYRDRYNRRLDSQDISKLIGTEIPQDQGAPGSQLRTATTEDKHGIQDLLTELTQWYPHIDKWIPKALEDLSSIRIIQYDNSISGIAIARDKEPDVRKYSTLYVTANSRGSAIGPHLVREEVRSAANNRIRKAFVTFAAELAPRIQPVLEQSGFVLEGFSPGRYRPGKGEWVMGKTFAYETIDSISFRDFIRRRLIDEVGGSLLNDESSHFTAQMPYISLSAFPTTRDLDIHISASTNPSEEYAQLRNQKPDDNWLFVSMLGRPADTSNELHDCPNWIDGVDIETRFYPLTLIQPTHNSIVVAIQPGFANQLIPRASQPQLLPPSRLQLRPDNVYYRTADRYQTLIRGSRIFFYVTEPESAIRGSAIITDFTVGTPEDCFARYGSRGVFSYEDLVERAGPAGKVLAISFDWYEEFANPVQLPEIKTAHSPFNPITANVVDGSVARDLLERGLS